MSKSKSTYILETDGVYIFSEIAFFLLGGGGAEGGHISINSRLRATPSCYKYLTFSVGFGQVMKKLMINNFSND
jgi:hypothetical protein